MFKEDGGKFYRRINPKNKGQGKVPEIDKFVTFGLEFGKMTLLSQTGNGWKQWQKI